jgi:class 3 adenylate cyclase/tetratricopeptide (TPR) repeat protein
MRCPRCQQENPAQAKFCLGCGARLALTCSSCGTELPGGARFCVQCGQPVGAPLAPQGAPASYTPKHLAEKILTSKSVLEGERKYVTVLFADMKGSMELLADRDPEDARKILDPVLERMMEGIHHYEGTVNQVMGDGVMALFGAPIAHEDHAVRACYAALRMQETIRRYSEEVRRTAGVPVSIRVGLNSGEVVVRSIGNDLRTDYTAVGQTTHLAARMEQAAFPGSILISAGTLRLAEGYVDAKPLGRIPVKGLPEPVEMYEVTGAGPARSRIQAAAARGLTRFVGRGEEFGQLRRALRLAEEGHGQVVATVGEAGVGKSRLFLEFARHHSGQGWLCLGGSSVSYGKATSYLPVIDLLKGYFKIQDRDDHREIREKLIGKLLALDRSLEPLVPAFLVLLNVPVDDPEWAALDPGQRRQRTLDAVKRLLLRESQVQPLILIFEDLHWIDGETQAVIDGLVESLPTARVLLLVNYRPEYEHGWGSKTYYAQLRLDALPLESASELLEALLGSDPGLASLKRLLAARAGGNPFFLEESVRGLVETGTLAGERGAHRLTRAVETILVPATVQASLAARIDRLHAEEKQLLQAASAIGKDVPFTILQATADMPDEALRRGLARLQAAEFLYEGQLFPDLEHTFKHALTHEVAYGSLLQDRRRELHARIAAAIERLYADRLAEHTEQLAYHAVRGGLKEKAVQYLREAGAKAVERSAYREAIDLLERALTILDGLPETDHTLAEALSVRMALGPALMATRTYVAAEVEECYLRALELCDRLEDTSRRFPVLWGLWYMNHGRGEYQRAFELAQHAFSFAQGGADPTYQLEAHHSMWATLLAMGRSTSAAEHCQRGLALYDRRERRPWWLYGTHDPGVCCRHMLSAASWLLGRPDGAVLWLREGLSLAGELRHPFTTVIALHNAAWVYYHRGDAEMATETSNAAVALGHDQGISLWPERVAVILARLLVEQGRIAEGLARAEEAIRQVTALGSTGWQDDFCRALLAGGYGIAGQPEKGLRLIEPLAARGSTGFYQPEIHRIRGELLLARSTSATADAEACFRQAIELAGARQEKSLELRAAMSLSRLLRRQGIGEEARSPLATVYAGFTEGLETADLRGARALLDELA